MAKTIFRFLFIFINVSKWRYVENAWRQKVSESYTFVEWQLIAVMRDNWCFLVNPKRVFRRRIQFCSRIVQVISFFLFLKDELLSDTQKAPWWKMAVSIWSVISERIYMIYLYHYIKQGFFFASIFVSFFSSFALFSSFSIFAKFKQSINAPNGQDKPFISFDLTVSARIWITLSLYTRTY